MPTLTFPSNPNPGDLYTIGTRTWTWNGAGWQIVSGITSTNPFIVKSAQITNTTASISTVTGALIVEGGVGVGGTVYAGDIYSNGVKVLVAGTGTIGNILGGTGTEVSIVGTTATIWSSDTLNTITSNGNTTSNTIHITNTSSNALQVDGGISIGNSITDAYTAPAILADSAVTLDSFDASLYRTAKYLVQIVDLGYTPNFLQSAEILVTHDDNGLDTLGYIVQYGIVTNFSELGTWDSIYSGGKILLQFTPNYTPANMQIKIVRTVLTA